LPRRTIVREYTYFLILLLFCGQAASCTRAELEHKSDAYNQAIAESNNRQILLNAVRASQRAPMSFVGFGSVLATPSLSGAASGTFNFDPFGLTSYSANPSLNVGGGFSSFSMDNLNNAEFAEQLQRRIPPAAVRYFEDLRFPKELVRLILDQEYRISAAERLRLHKDSQLRCASHQDPRTKEFCDQLRHDEDIFLQRCPGSFLETDGVILNTARDQCSMIKVQMLTRQMRLLDRRFFSVPRTGQGVLYYLGELVAAQNYSPYSYQPELFTRTADGKRRTVPVFAVRRGVPAAGEAAVSVVYNGDSFYIPKPALGTLDEARSLQVLDLVSQIITLATSKDALPKTTTLTLVPVR
jgi:hypothetical protein